MARILCILAAGFFFAAPVGAQEKSPPSAPLQTSAKPEALIVHLQQRIPELMKEGEVPALAMALIREGKLVWRHSFGVKNAETKAPVTDSSVFEAASLSKPVFAYAVLKLVDRGQFDLDKPLNQYLPGNYDVGDDPRLNQITARRVLSHTTGFPNWRPRDNPVLKIFFTPGEKFSYSGEGFVYLAKVVEHITGEPFDAFMKKTVFVPLGMNNSSYVWQDKYERLKADRHNFIGKPTGLNKVTQANAAASLNTTASDYGKFVAAILQGAGLKKETAKLMLTPQVYVDEACTNCTERPLEKPSSQVAWGLGWGLQNTDEGISFWHWGDNGNSKAYVVAFTKQKIGVAIFTNSTNGLAIAREIVNETVGGKHPALDWLHYESYNSPAKKLLKNILAKGVEEALREYRQNRAADAALNEGQMNQLGYDLLYGARRVQEAIAIFKLNVADHPQSFNVYDSLGEAYMVNNEKELAIQNYQKSLELNPNNTNGAEALKKLQAN